MPLLSPSLSLALFLPLSPSIPLFLSLSPSSSRSRSLSHTTLRAASGAEAATERRGGSFKSHHQNLVVAFERDWYKSNRCVVVTEEGSYLRHIDFCITQLKAEGPSRTCNESKEEEEEKSGPGSGPGFQVPAGLDGVLPHGGLRPFHQKSTCITQLTLGPNAVQIWPRNPRVSEATKPSNLTVWMGTLWALVERVWVEENILCGLSLPTADIQTYATCAPPSSPLVFRLSGRLGKGHAFRVSGFGFRPAHVAWALRLPTTKSHARH